MLRMVLALLALPWLRQGTTTETTAMDKATPTKKRRGPAPLPPQDQRTIRLGVCVTPTELDTLTKKAFGGLEPPADMRPQTVRQQTAAYVRQVALEGKAASIVEPPPAINTQAWGDLGKLAANLHQVVRAINRGQAVGVSADAVTELAAMVLQLRQALGIRA